MNTFGFGYSGNSNLDLGGACMGVVYDTYPYYAYHLCQVILKYLHE